jgi:hypothetical protein
MGSSGARNRLFVDALAPGLQVGLAISEAYRR